MTTTQIHMTDAQFEKLRKVIYERSGIWFGDNKKYVLESRLARRLQELEMDDFGQYTMYLTIGPYQTVEFQEMFDRITINETSFFRNMPQLDVFERSVLPRILEARRAQRTLRIWSAACSTGEEAYTIAMQIHRTLGVRLADWRVEILATDISEKVLVAAAKGAYGAYSMQNVGPLERQRYFTQEGANHVISPMIQSMVAFERMNLRDTVAARRHGTWDVIFCRNVMIYFDEPMREHCLKLFHQTLADDGVLFIGHSESLRGSSLFAALPESEAFAYTKATERRL